MDPVAPPDETARREATERLAATSGAAAPGGPAAPGVLGRLEELATWLAACQGRSPARPLRRARVVLFAAEHGVADAGVSAFPPSATAARVAAVATEDAAVCAMARVGDAGVRVVDVGLTGPSPCRGADARRVRDGSGRIDREDALDAEQTAAALRVGREVADEEVDAGADLLVPGELGVGVSTPLAVLGAAMTAREPGAVVGRGSGIDDTVWMRMTAAVRDALRRARPAGRDPVELLTVAGGADLAALVGFLGQAARRRTPVLLDGAAVCTAALLADHHSPGARAWWVAGTRCTEPVQALALENLGLDPLLALQMRAGQGTGALAALPLLRMALATLGEDAGAAVR